jgi:ATP-dependent RNA helicase MRH4
MLLLFYRNKIRRVTPGTPGTSRTRLVKDLTPRPVPGLPRKFTHKLIEVAPRNAPSRFSRDRPPHASRHDKKLLRPAPRPAEERRRTRRTSLRRTEGKREPKTRGDGVRVPRRVHRTSHISTEFDFSVTPEAPHTLPSTFSSPPLSSGLLQSVHEVLGPNARPTPIQSLSLKHLFVTPPLDSYRRFLLASETGSGKSLAYLLPMLHDLKTAEHLSPRRTGPRALVLAPTHELSRQLASFGKALVHHSRLRVQTASRANVASARVSAAKMAHGFGGDDAEGEFEVRPGNGTGHTLDVLVGTPPTVLGMVRGGRWDKESVKSEGKRQKKVPASRPEVSLSEIEWVVVDEADVLFGTPDSVSICLPFSYLHRTDPDFIDQTLLLLSDIAAARGKPVPAAVRDKKNKSQAPIPFDYPFNLVLTSATIPAALATHLEARHPKMTRLVSPRLHRLPTRLALEFSPYNSGNRNAEVLGKLKAVWRDDALAGRRRARIVIFSNTRARAAEMGAYLSENGVPNIVVTGQSNDNGEGRSGRRVYGSNSHLAGFLKPILNKSSSLHSQPPYADGQEEEKREPATGLGKSKSESESESESPRVLLSTSLLARGLDFDPSVSHVFVLDPPRNTADFLHRAGRTARAGSRGKVVVFGKGAGRGAGKLREMRQRLAALRVSARS